MSTSTKRLQSGPTPPVQVDWDEWVPLPESIIRRFPEMGEWERRNRLRWESIQAKLNLALDKLQQET